MSKEQKYCYVDYTATVWKWAEVPYEEGDTDEDILKKFYDGNITDEGEEDSGHYKIGDISGIEYPEPKEADEP